MVLHTCTHMYVCTFIHTHTHTHTRTRIHTPPHTHTHPPPPPPPPHTHRRLLHNIMHFEIQTLPLSPLTSADHRVDHAGSPVKNPHISRPYIMTVGPNHPLTGSGLMWRSASSPASCVSSSTGGLFCSRRGMTGPSSTVSL